MPKGVYIRTEKHKGRIPWNKGKCWSKEVKEKMSRSRNKYYANGGINVSPWEGKKLSEEHKRLLPGLSHQALMNSICCTPYFFFVSRYQAHFCYMNHLH